MSVDDLRNARYFDADHDGKLTTEELHTARNEVKKGFEVKDLSAIGKTFGISKRMYKSMYAGLGVT